MSPTKIEMRDSEVSRLAQVNLTSDPFKTGKKHFFNMLRPTLYERYGQDTSPATTERLQNEKMSAVSKNGENKKLTAIDFYRKRGSKMLSMSDIIFLEKNF